MSDEPYEFTFSASDGFKLRPGDIVRWMPVSGTISNPSLFGSTDDDGDEDDSPAPSTPASGDGFVTPSPPPPGRVTAGSPSTQPPSPSSSPPAPLTPPPTSPLQRLPGVGRLLSGLLLPALSPMPPISPPPAAPRNPCVGAASANPGLFGSILDANLTTIVLLPRDIDTSFTLCVAQVPGYTSGNESSLTYWDTHILSDSDFTSYPTAKVVI
eukprot:1973407-Prymnesium_polylepis.1